MSKHRPGTRGYFKKHVTSDGVTTLLVGADDLTDPKRPYRGPQAAITWDDTWLNICTDPYEGHVMLNIEAINKLRFALGSRTAKKRCCSEPRLVTAQFGNGMKSSKTPV